MSEDIKTKAEQMGDEILVKILKALVDNGKLIIVGLGGHGKCLDGNTLVSTPNGKIKLSKLKIGDKISGIDRDGIVENTFVSEKSTLLITTETNKTIRCSPEHWFLTENGYVQAKNLNIGYCIVTVSSDIDGKHNKRRTNISISIDRWRRNNNDFNTTKIQRKKSTRKITAINDYNKFFARIVYLAERPLNCKRNMLRCEIQNNKTVKKSYLPIFTLSQFSRNEGIANIDATIPDCEEKTSGNPNSIYRKTNGETLSSRIRAGRNQTFSGNPQIKLKQEKITKIQTEPNRQKLYDIQTTLRYYIANDIVVHNSIATMHIARMLLRSQEYKDGKFIIKICDSANVWKWKFDKIPFINMVKTRNIPEEEHALLLDLGFTDTDRNTQIVENLMRGDYLQQREMMNANSGQLPIRRIYVIEEVQNILGSYSLSGNSGKFWLKETSEGRNYGQYMIGLGQRFADISAKVVERTRYFLLGAISGDNDASKIKRMFSSDRGQRIVNCLLGLEPHQFLFLDKENPEFSFKIYFPDFQPNGKPFEYDAKTNGKIRAERVFI